jgi:hypothetical protein
MLKLQIREIGRSLSGDRMPMIAPDVGEAAHLQWHDSSLDLQRGLDVVELPAESVTEAQAPRDPDSSKQQQ